MVRPRENEQVRIQQSICFPTEQAEAGIRAVMADSPVPVVAAHNLAGEAEESALIADASLPYIVRIHPASTAGSDSAS